MFATCNVSIIYSLFSVLRSLTVMVAGDLPVVISCASLALADAGIMLYDLIASVSVVRVIVDPLISQFYSASRRKVLY